MDWKDILFWTAAAWVVFSTLVRAGETIERAVQLWERLIGRIRGRKLSEPELRKKTLEVARNLHEYAYRRRTNEPRYSANREPFSTKNWEESTAKLLQYSTETTAGYKRDLLPDVIEIRQELLAHGISNDSFELAYKHGTNLLLIEDVAAGLVEMASQLKTE